MTAPHKYTEFMRLLNEQRAAELRTITEGQRLGLRGTLKKLNDICYATGRIVNDVLTKVESEQIGAELDAGDPRIILHSLPQKTSYANIAHAQAASVTAAGIRAMRDAMLSHGGTLFPIPALTPQIVPPVDEAPKFALEYPMTLTPPSRLAGISTIETLPSLNDEKSAWAKLEKLPNQWEIPDDDGVAPRDEKINDAAPTPPEGDSNETE